MFRLDREAIALRVAKEFRDGDVVNLGIGIPTLAANYIPEGRTVWFHTENGAVGFGGSPPEGEEDIHMTNAGGGFVTALPGMSVFDTIEAFTIVRGGYLDITVLGAMQVSEKGDLANWLRPGRIIGGIGGAMDIVAGAKTGDSGDGAHRQEGHPENREGVYVSAHGGTVREYDHNGHGGDRSWGGWTDVDGARARAECRGDSVGHGCPTQSVGGLEGNGAIRIRVDACNRRAYNSADCGGGPDFEQLSSKQLAALTPQFRL